MSAHETSKPSITLKYERLIEELNNLEISINSLYNFIDEISGNPLEADKKVKSDAFRYDCLVNTLTDAPHDLREKANKITKAVSLLRTLLMAEPPQTSSVDYKR